MKVFGLITARGGSKGIPGKNIKPLAGKPLIAWTIQAALESSVLNRVIVSTDNNKIAKVSREYGAEVPFIRPKRLANDDSPHIDTIIHAINWLKEHRNNIPSWLMLLQPTSPLRTVEDIRTAIELINEPHTDSIISVSEPPFHPYVMKTIGSDGKLRNYDKIPDGYIPRQAFPDVHYVNGAIYLTKTAIILKEKTLFPENTYPYIMPVERSLDIDTPWDLSVGEILLKRKSPT